MCVLVELHGFSACRQCREVTVINRVFNNSCSNTASSACPRARPGAFITYSHTAEGRCCTAGPLVRLAFDLCRVLPLSLFPSVSVFLLNTDTLPSSHVHLDLWFLMALLCVMGALCLDTKVSCWTERRGRATRWFC